MSEGAVAFLERTGRPTAALLLIAILSGFVLAYQYEPADPFISTVAMEATLRWGGFWRGLHFWSSQGFLLVLMLHTWYRAVEPGARAVGRWVALSLLVPAGVFTLFSGYLLKYDATGEAAAAIAEHLLLRIPVVGTMLDRLLVAVSTEGLNRVYGVHILLSFILWLVGTWYHTRRVIMGWGWFTAAALSSVAVAALVPAPLDLPGHQASLIKGPWFFLGVQELLRHLPPLLAGVVLPMVPVAALAAMAWPRARRAAQWVVAGWLASYLVLTLFMWQR